jgi:hypothetical protein
MCIVSFYRKNDEFVLTHNRDEQINRTSSNQILERVYEGKTFFSPVDERAKGTWIFYSDQYIACILNGGFEKPIDLKESYKKSRGIILLDLLRYDSVNEFIETENLSDIAPFTIFVFERVNKNAYLLYWNEKDLTVEDVSREEIVTWCSSTLYSPTRRGEIDKEFKLNKDLNPDEIMTLHDQLKMNKGDLFDFLATTSISQIIMNNSEIDMKYCQLF